MLARTITSIVLLIILVFAGVFINTPGFVIFVSILSSIGVYELTKNTKFVKNKMLICVSIIVAIIMPFWISSYVALDVWGLLYIFLAFLALISIRYYGKVKLNEVTTSLFATIYVALMFSIFVLISDKFPVHNRFYFVLVFCGSWVSDTGAFAFGKLFGKRKLAPEISPNKTVEGFVGGVFLATLSFGVVGYIYKFVMDYFFNKEIAVNYVYLFIIGAVCSVVGVFGDLFASTIKRQTSLKDFGNIMPGHGGVMDRFDSTLFVLPTLYLFINILPNVVK